MNHPAEDWRDDTAVVTTLDESKRDLLDQEIKFNGLVEGDLMDHHKCYEWELRRTRQHLGQDIKTDKLFPFYLSTYPEQSYLSHTLEQRKEWGMLEGSSDFEEYQDLFRELKGTNYVSELFGMKIPTTKVPLTIHIDPNWGREKLKKVFAENMEQIEVKTAASKAKMESEGYVFDNCSNTRDLARLKTKLKLLGRYRLYACVGLSWSKTIEEYGLKDNASERRFRADIRNLIPKLPLE